MGESQYCYLLPYDSVEGTMRERYEYHPARYDKGQEECSRGRSLECAIIIDEPFHQFLGLNMEIGLSRIQHELKSIFDGI